MSVLRFHPSTCRVLAVIAPHGIPSKSPTGIEKKEQKEEAAGSESGMAVPGAGPMGVAVHKATEWGLVRTTSDEPKTLDQCEYKGDVLALRGARSPTDTVSRHVGIMNCTVAAA